MRLSLCRTLILGEFFSGDLTWLRLALRLSFVRPPFWDCDDLNKGQDSVNRSGRRIGPRSAVKDNKWIAPIVVSVIISGNHKRVFVKGAEVVSMWTIDP